MKPFRRTSATTSNSAPAPRRGTFRVARVALVALVALVLGSVGAGAGLATAAPVSGASGDSLSAPGSRQRPAPAGVDGETRAAASWIYHGRFEIRNSHNGRCLDAHASYGGGNGNPIGLWDCVGSTGQWFRISDWNGSIGGRLLAVQLGGPHNHVDAFASDGGGNGNRVGNWFWTGHPLQHWRFDFV